MPCRRKFMSVALLTKQANFPKIVSPRPNPSNLLGLKDSIFCFPYFFCARCFNEVGALFCEFFGASTPRKRVLFHIIPYYSLLFIRLDSLSYKLKQSQGPAPSDGAHARTALAAGARAAPQRYYEAARAAGLWGPGELPVHEQPLHGAPHPAVAPGSARQEQKRSHIRAREPQSYSQTI